MKFVFYDHNDARTALKNSCRDCIERGCSICSISKVGQFVDGLMLLLQKPGVMTKFRANYNKKNYDYYFYTLFVFTLHGTVLAHVLDAPESLHNTTVASFDDLYTHHTRIYNHYGWRVVLVSAFAQADHDFMTKSGPGTAQNI